MEQTDKLTILRRKIKEMGKIAIAFSGGVDSTFLLKIAHDLLGESVVAVTACSSTYPERELKKASAFAQKIGVKHIIIFSEELEIEGFSDNPPDRCYFCKHELFTKIREVANEHCLIYIADGSNIDDLNDYRPGMKALNELEVVSPLMEAGLKKEDIRHLSREIGLPTWNKPAFACLSSRFPYGEKISREKLRMIDKAEQYLLDLGFEQLRVRHHGDIARIEVAPRERSRFFDGQLMDQIYEAFKQIGFMYTALDLKGYRTGSMNEKLDPHSNKKG